ncbi:plasmid pRiA4b ORF-3 family protein [Mesorhizobium sp. M0830]|uniref:IS1096 element passenger TnpR family protein n=1 Tax=Mesorhizobium sp. M0830 TaxID=2957008 RepID=UPI003338984A
MLEGEIGSSGGASGSILQLTVRLLDVNPMIWRRVLVPAAMTLKELHGVFQVLLGWRSLHLYRFRIHAVHYAFLGAGSRTSRPNALQLQFPPQRQVRLRIRHGGLLEARGPDRSLA